MRYTDASGEFWHIVIGAAGAGAAGAGGVFAGGAVVGGVSGYAGWAVAGSGIPMASTAGMTTSSLINSVGTYAYIGGQIPISVSLGVVSYDFTNNDFGYLGEKGNKWYENLGYGFGALANLSDVVSLFGGGVNTDLIVEKKDAISHSVLVNQSEGINISVGPYKDLGEGTNMAVLKSGTGTFKELSRTMKGKIWENHATDGYGWKVPINNVNKNILTKLSNNLQLKMNNQTLMWNLLGKSCVGYTAKALWSVGVPNLGGVHPYWLQLQMITRQVGIYSSPYFYQIRKKDKIK
ncbi:hypothetical protein LJC00_00835 [Dysgonomonas sp. OttesenSCG-928-M03]|nr:hypothetical protein [Dysgonomonas sp. OttesenSCG-928-M03]